MFEILRHIWSWFEAQTPERRLLGLDALPPDDADFDVGFLGWGKYRPLSERRMNAPSIVHDQRFNTCAFNARVAAKEKDENIPLSTRFMVAIGANSGIITGDGFTNLRAVESLVQRNGVCEYALLPDVDGDFEAYSDPNILNIETITDAAKHKSQTFWAIKDKYQAWKALDEGRTIRIGVKWRTSMQKGFLHPPYILNFERGLPLGGHAILVIGYDRKFHGEDVFICQNSYGREYGEQGRMCLRVEDFEREIATFGAFCDLDIPKDKAKELMNTQV